MALHLENFRIWLWKQPRYVDAAVFAAIFAASGAAFGALHDFLYHAVTGSPFFHTCSSSFIFALHFSIFIALERLKGDTFSAQFCMIAGFVSGAAIPLVMGVGGVDIGQILYHALTMSLSLGGLDSKLAEIFFKPQDPSYVKTKRLLKNLGLDTYEKNFKKGLLNDYTLPLLTDSDLKEVKIPPGARLLILDHIRRYYPENSQRRTW